MIPQDEGENARGTLEHCRVAAEEWHRDDELCLHSCIIGLQAVRITLPVAGALEVRVPELSLGSARYRHHQWPTSRRLDNQGRRRRRVHQYPPDFALEYEASMCMALRRCTIVMAKCPPPQPGFPG